MIKGQTVICRITQQEKIVESYEFIGNYIQINIRSCGNLWSMPFLDAEHFNKTFIFKDIEINYYEKLQEIIFKHNLIIKKSDKNLLVGIYSMLKNQEEHYDKISPITSEDVKDYLKSMEGTFKTNV